MPELSGLEIAVIANEVKDRLRGAYVNNIYSLNDTQVIRFRASGSDDALLVVSPKYGAWLSTRVSERGETSAFTTKLRAEITRSKFASVEQVDLDRVLALDFSEPGRSRRLIVEMMPPGNLILTGENEKIVLLLNEVRSKKRRLLVGGMYAPPAQSRLSPEHVTASDLLAATKSSGTIGLALGRSVALPRKYVIEVLARMGLNEGDSVNGIQGRLGDLADAVNSLVFEARSEPRPTIAGVGDEVDVYAVQPKSGRTTLGVKSVSEAADEIILPLLLAGLKKEGVNGDERRIGELKATEARLRSEAERLGTRALAVRKIAATIGANPPGQAPATLSEAGDILPKEVSEEAREGFSSASVASRLFAYAKKLEKQARDAVEASEGISKKIGRIEVRPERTTKQLRIAKKEWYEKFRWFYTSGGRLAVGGRDAQSNSLLIKRHSGKGDTIYHADLFGSPFFVLKGGEEQTEDEVREVAQATASFSSAWKTGLSAADAYWVEPEQISSSAPSGEYLPRGSFLITGRKNPVRSNLVELAIGIEPSGRVISGPESVIRNQAGAYVVIRPERTKLSDTAKKVKKELESLSGGKLHETLTLDEVMHMLPPGGGKLVRRRIGQKDKSAS